MMKLIKIISFLFMAFILTSCEVKDVNIEMPNNIEIQELSAKSIKLKIYLPIENQNNFSFKIKGVNMNLLVNEKNLGKIDKIDKIKIEANSKNIYPVYFEIDTKEAMSSLLYLYNELQKNPDIEVSGYIKVSKLGISKKIRVKHKQAVSL